jgi:hypothetical protein
MKLNFLLTSSLLVSAVSAFQTSRPVPAQRLAPLNVATMGGTIDLSETAQRDVWSLQQWAQQCGCQIADGFELTTQDGEDWSVMTNSYLPAGTPVLYVPSQMILTSRSVEQEFGGNLISAENALDQYQESAKRKPLFRLMIKVLAEYEKGVNSPYYPWLNSLPRRFYNGVAMTSECQEND